jgi:hypothetical protein
VPPLYRVFGGLFRLVLVKEAGFTGIAAEVPFIGVDGARADGIGVPADNAFIPNFPVGVVRPNVLPRRLPPFLALGGVGGLEAVVYRSMGNWAVGEALR